MIDNIRVRFTYFEVFIFLFLFVLFFYVRIGRLDKIKLSLSKMLRKVLSILVIKTFLLECIYNVKQRTINT